MRRPRTAHLVSACTQRNRQDVVTTTHLGPSDPERVAKLPGQGDAVTSVAIGADDAGTLPDYAPTPRSAIGSALNDQGYYAGAVERNLYWVTRSEERRVG